MNDLVLFPLAVVERISFILPSTAVGKLVMEFSEALLKALDENTPLAPTLLAAVLIILPIRPPCHYVNRKYLIEISAEDAGAVTNVNVVPEIE